MAFIYSGANVAAQVQWSRILSNTFAITAPTTALTVITFLGCTFVYNSLLQYRAAIDVMGQIEVDHARFGALDQIQTLNLSLDTKDQESVSIELSPEILEKFDLVSSQPVANTISSLKGSETLEFQAEASQPRLNVKLFIRPRHVGAVNLAFRALVGQSLSADVNFTEFVLP